FVLDTFTHMSAAPQLPGFEVNLVDETTLEIGLTRQQDLNAVFAQLSAQQISVKSMRNKSNRLEQLFVSLLKDTATAQQTVDRRSSGGANAKRLQVDCLPDHRDEGNSPFRAYLGANPGAAGYHDCAVLRHLRQPDRQPYRFD